MKKLFYAIILLFTTQSWAQDPHFSQFYAAPWRLNPAMTGLIDCNWRAAAIFRGQWGEILRNESVPMYRTYGVGLDFRTNKGFGKYDAWGFGASFLGDQAGALKFGTYNAALALSYFKALDKRGHHYLSLGIQPEIYNQTIDYTQAQWGSQWDGSAYNPLLPSLEYYVDNNLLYFDLAAGLLYYGKFSKRTNAYAGFSLYHALTPKNSHLGDGSVRLPMKFVGHAGVRFPLKGRFDMQPKVIVMSMSKSIEMNIATDIRILFEERFPEGNNFRIGAMYRIVGGDNNAPWRDRVMNSEAIILSAGVDFNGVSGSVAYDINISELLPGSRARGAFEVALSYTGCFKKRKSSTIYCPRF